MAEQPLSTQSLSADGSVALRGASFEARDELRIVVRDTPRSQGNKRPYRNVHTGRIQMTEPASLKTWREAVKAAALTAAGGRPLPLFPRPTPVSLRLTFTVGRPQSHYRTGRNAHLLRSNAPEHPVCPPDGDKVLRGVCDALTAAGIWWDDRQAVRQSVERVYAYPADGAAYSPHADALSTPGAVIRLEAMR